MKKENDLSCDYCGKYMIVDSKRESHDKMTLFLKCHGCGGRKTMAVRYGDR